MTSARRAGIGIALAALVVGLGYNVLRLRSELVETPVTVPPPPARPAPALDKIAPKPGVYSNIYRYDYVGPEACGKCHTKNYESWKQHPHSRMNRNPTGASVVGDFADRKVTYGDATIVFSRGLGELTATIYRGETYLRQLRVTRVIGSRYVQMYMCVQSDGPEPADDPVYTREVKLPFSYWIDRDEWFPETYDETPGTPEYGPDGKLGSYYKWTEPGGRTWQAACIKCHNTYPYASRFAAGPGKLLVGFPPEDVNLVATAKKTRKPEAAIDLDTSELVTMGISCESCHFGGREHAIGGQAISFLPRGQDLAFPKATDELGARARSEPYVVNAICAQCHSATPAQGPVFPNGAASWNAREALDLKAGACASKILCTSCHNPHEAGPPHADAPDSPRHLGACASCHQKLATPAAAAAHSKHAAGVTCLDCHMPRIVHGLGGMIRSHRISSPNDPRMLKEDAPNACNLCHLDKSIRWTVTQLGASWGEAPVIGADWKAPDEPAGPRWLRASEPAVRALAVDAYSRTPLGKAALPELVAIVDDPAPPSRMFGVLALERILGRKIGEVEITPWGSPELRKKQLADLRARIAK